MSDSRRRFLHTLSRGAASGTVISVLPGCASDAMDQKQASGTVPAGSWMNLEEGEVRILDEPIVVIRDAEGIYAMSTICTHSQCDMRVRGEISSSSLECNCHGSSFDAEGSAILGPATGRLTHFAVSAGEEGELTVDTDSPVQPSERFVP